jgi:hypothetical protein
LKDCIDLYSSVPFWGDKLKRVISENNLASD